MDELGTLDFALQLTCFKWIGFAAQLSVKLRDRLKSEWFKSEVPKPLEDGKLWQSICQLPTRRLTQVVPLDAATRPSSGRRVWQREPIDIRSGLPSLLR